MCKEIGCEKQGIYNIEGEKFQITYHRESSKIAPSTREFLKPANS